MSTLCHVWTLHLAPFPKKKPPARAASSDPQITYGVCYLSWVETVLKVLLRVEPTALALAIITIEIPAASKQYSIAVAPDSSFKNARALDIRHLLHALHRRFDALDR